MDIEDEVSRVEIIKQLSSNDKLEIAYNILSAVHREAEAGNKDAQRFIEEAIESQASRSAL